MTNISSDVEDKKISNKLRVMSLLWTSVKIQVKSYFKDLEVIYNTKKMFYNISW
jgi:archaellum biogenesis ATPase FlaH